MRDRIDVEGSDPELYAIRHDGARYKHCSNCHEKTLQDPLTMALDEPCCFCSDECRNTYWQNELT